MVFDDAAVSSLRVAPGRAGGGGRASGGGRVALALGFHRHEWVRDDEMVGLFHCADLACDGHAVCPGCLNSINVALRAEAAGLVVYWCLAHGGRARG